MKLLRGGLVLTVGLLIAADTKNDATKKDAEKLQGTWMAETLEEGGKKAPDMLLKDIRYKWVFKDDKLGIQDGPQQLKGSYKLDAAKKPKTIDVTLIRKAEGGGKESATVVIQGIYEFDGAQLKICVTGGKERPKEFTSPNDPNCRLVTFKREKK